MNHSSMFVFRLAALVECRLIVISPWFASEPGCRSISGLAPILALPLRRMRIGEIDSSVDLCTGLLSRAGATASRPATPPGLSLEIGEFGRSFLDVRRKIRHLLHLANLNYFVF